MAPPNLENHRKPVGFISKNEISQVLFFKKVCLNEKEVVIYPVLSFWEKRGSVLIDSLSDLKIVFVEGGEGFKVPCINDNFFIIFDEIYNRLRYAL